MHICIAADENYALILQTVMISVIENNRDMEDIFFHIFESEMTEQTKNSIKNIAVRNNTNIPFYNIDEKMKAIKSKIVNDWAQRNSYVAYARLYMPLLLPKEIKNFLYLDCDTLVVDNLQNLFEVDMKNYIVAGVKDVLPYIYKEYKGDYEGKYINSGVLLINNTKWNEENITPKILKYCEEHSADDYPDQDAINIVLKDKILILPPQYCVFYPENSWKPNQQIRGYGDKNTYYSVQELAVAKSNPVIIHYVDTFLGRPWQLNNINPYAETWMKYNKLIISDRDANFKEKVISRNQKIIRLMYRFIPEIIFLKIYYARRNKGIQKKIKEENIKC